MRRRSRFAALPVVLTALLALALLVVSPATPAPATHFTVVSDNGAPTAGDVIHVTVTALDSSGPDQIDAGYSGTVHFTSSDGQADLPINYTFTGSGSGNDNGSHTFNVTLKTAGGQT